ncbi:hypothetical protein I2I05_16610 [Hymenobacter sp. BT683]|uniref:DUF4249 family protein n=1 Tax=Hymenobacter jeongseonensis TaxID=2791027 RepID=A0ABS0IKW7_9BACT|nr:hypothetical protein [Hymenobacter jeongseonensis]MBF9239026.1 hypothetical protein [Hymenobacter jeongseonensis]
MRFRLLLLLLPVLLGACSKTNGPVRLDFVGNTTLTSSNRTVSANDTLSTRAYAVGNDNALRRLRISVTYEPGPEPFLYPLPLSGFDPSDAPAAQTIVYLDSLITPIQSTSTYTSPFRGGEYLFENRFSARSTSGTEVWQYTVTDATGESASRAFRLTVRKPDSAAVFHNYNLVVRPRPRTALAFDTLRERARVFLNLSYGLLLPKYAVLNNEATVQPNQQLVDVIATVRNGSITLEAPAHAGQLPLLPVAKWPIRRRTELRRTNLSSVEFNAAATTAAFTTAFTNGELFTAAPDGLSTGALAKDQVIAFRTTEGKTGLLLVSDVVLGTAPVLTCVVRVQK